MLGPGCILAEAIIQKLVFCQSLVPINGEYGFVEAMSVTRE